MTSLVTGATGLLGSHLTDLLVARGERPRILVRPGESLDGLAHAGVDVCWGDMTDATSLEIAVRDVDRVFHCAARTGPWGPPAEYRAVNVWGLETLLGVALTAGVRRFVHVSSITVHGNDVRGTADETAPMRVEPNPYSRSKVAAERLLARAVRERGAPVTIVRPGWIYGPRDTASFARFAALIEQRRMIVIGPGTNHVPLVFSQDAAASLLLASEAAHAVGREYVIVNDEPVTQRDFLDAIATELNVAPPTRHLPYRLAVLLGATAEAGARLTRRRQPPPLMRYGVNLLGGENRFVITRARRELGFSPQVRLAEGVKRAVEWFRAGHEALAA